MIRKFQYRMHEREVQHLNGKANDVVRYNLANAIVNDVVGMVDFSEEPVDAMFGEKDRLYTTQFVVMPESHFDHVLRMLESLKLCTTPEGRLMIDEIKREIIYK